MAENNNEVRNPFDEYSFEVLAALNHLITTNEVCKNDKAVMKINRFKKWLLDFTATEQKDNSMNV
ncbi:MAG: hypothetical protein [Bacteriophage sp.]|jgi:hypothetical protein|nr:MAG: hypothetical protein [Bacteriophage sp.]